MNIDKNSVVAIVLNAPKLNVKVEEEYSICADGGVNLSVGNFIPNVVVGDFDSAKVEGNFEKVTCPEKKNYTDGERAIAFAKSKGFKEIVIYGANGGRCDHEYANLSLLKFAYDIGLKAKIRNEYGYIFYFEAPYKVNFDGENIETISVIPFGDSATVDNSCGLYYGYNALTLTRTHAGRGISNVPTGDKISFDLSKGAILTYVNLKKNND